MNAENAEGFAVCPRIAAALVLSADEELSDTEWLAVARHLDQCAACRSQWTNFAFTDQRLLECAAELKELSPSGSVGRARLLSALGDRENRRWSGSFPAQGWWRWAAVSLATLSLVAAAAWTVTTPSHLERRRPDPLHDTPSGGVDVVRLRLSLAPAGDPFLDGSPEESMVLADVAVGSDGRPTGVRLAE